MAKTTNKKYKGDVALVTLRGTVTWSEEYRTQDNKKEIHSYFIAVIEEYENKEGKTVTKKHVFQATHFNQPAKSGAFGKDTKVEIKGFLKINSYLNEDDEWVNKPYIQINTIKEIE